MEKYCGTNSAGIPAFIMIQETIILANTLYSISKHTLQYAVIIMNNKTPSCGNKH